MELGLVQVRARQRRVDEPGLGVTIVHYWGDDGPKESGHDLS